MKKILLYLTLTFGLLLADTRVYHTKVDVIKSEPMYKTISKQVPYEECYDEQYEQKVPTYSNKQQSQDNSLGLDTLIGVTGGVVVGNQIGKGNGKVAAKIIGGLLGGAIAHKIRDNNVSQQQSNDYYYETKNVRKCTTKYETYQEEIHVGYKNYFLFNNKEIYKITKTPRKKISIKNTISFKKHSVFN